MKKYIIALFIALLPIVATYAQPNTDSVLSVCRKVNNYFMQHCPDPTADSFVGKQRPSNIWTRSVYYEGLMALYAVDAQSEYMDYALNWATFHQWGFRQGDSTRNADNICAAQTYIDLYRISQQPERIAHTLRNAQMFLNSDKYGDWTWIDAIQMQMPVFAKLARTTGDTRYAEKMWQMYSFTRNELAGGLFNAADGLWWRDADFVSPYAEPDGNQCYWSRGNGWVVAALVRTIAEMPRTAPHRKQFLADFKAMIKALHSCQRADGSWNVSLHSEANYGGKELTGTSLFVYGIAWGINNGHLSRRKYMPMLMRAWGAMCSCVHSDGRLGYVQGTGRQPSDAQPVSFDVEPDFEDFGTGCFLLAGSEVYKLLK